jgi:ribosomal protein S18 acetylase RimI-like enzyme
MRPGETGADTMWRRMQEHDLSQVAVIAGIVHPDLPEDDAVFADRLRLYPQGCHVFAHDGAVAGYILSHPWHDGVPPALNQVLHTLPPAPSVYYIHDLALMPAARGSDAGPTIVRDLIAQARQAGFSSIALVAVSGSEQFWHRLGFRPAGSLIDLASYGGGARYMTLPLR